MKTSTRLFILIGLLLGQLSALAATITIQVGDNFYSPQAVTIRPGDVVTWQYVGFSSHPTASDNGAWATFQMNSANPTRSITFNTVGAFPYHCTAHGGPGFGQFGTITVSNATPAEQARPNTPTLSVYPNPSKGMVSVSVGQQGQDYKLRLTNVLGREVRTLALKPESAMDVIHVDLTDLPAGMYFYSLVVGDKVMSTKRLILQN
ncbi:T9SS type A sorting domain-containing protein [Hymenobacter sp. BT175]|uniref:T9SS type A sorting domain-containing protein n=1 Tax=Hymenobacter translucens TaxID=2886507 RepID=UPI001D0E52BB|nr:T9SS type A sorting domain-containing protein [Hymenobacter translucens]MCC2546846.1 T9SS type A sorting domain-containing protein [Hymenobacter translucens]